MNYEDDLSDDNVAQCPFCGHILVTAEMAVDMAASRWSGTPCEHTRFVAVDSLPFSGFEYRSVRFNAYLHVPDDPDLDVQIPSDEDDNEPMPIEEVVDRIGLPGYQWDCCGDGFFIVYFGFHPSASKTP